MLQYSVLTANKFLHDIFWLYYFQHVASNIVEHEIRHKEILQSSFDLLGELIKFNWEAFKTFDSVLTTPSKVFLCLIFIYILYFLSNAMTTFDCHCHTRLLITNFLAYPFLLNLIYKSNQLICCMLGCFLNLLIIFNLS